MKSSLFIDEISKKINIFVRFIIKISFVWCFSFLGREMKTLLPVWKVEVTLSLSLQMSLSLSLWSSLPFPLVVFFISFRFTRRCFSFLLWFAMVRLAVLGGGTMGMKIAGREKREERRLEIVLWVRRDVLFSQSFGQGLRCWSETIGFSSRTNSSRRRSILSRWTDGNTSIPRTSSLVSLLSSFVTLHLTLGTDSLFESIGRHGERCWVCLRMYWREVRSETRFTAEYEDERERELFFIVLCSLGASECAPSTAIICSSTMRLDLDLLAENLSDKEVRDLFLFLFLSELSYFLSVAEVRWRSFLVSCPLHSRSGTESLSMDEYWNHQSMSLLLLLLLGVEERLSSFPLLFSEEIHRTNGQNTLFPLLGRTFDSRRRTKRSEKERSLRLSLRCSVSEEWNLFV